MIKLKPLLIPILCLAAAIILLYARPFMNQDLPTQSFQKHTLTRLPDNIITIHYHERSPYYITGPLDVYGLSKTEFKFIHFSGMPQGNKRYLLFSQRVDNKIIEKINTAVKLYLQTKA